MSQIGYRLRPQSLAYICAPLNHDICSISFRPRDKIENKSEIRSNTCILGHSDESVISFCF